MILSKMPEFIEKYEPQMEQTLTTAITQLKKYPEEADLFYSNWKKLDAVVRKNFDTPAPAPVLSIGAGKRRKTRKNSKRK